MKDIKTKALFGAVIATILLVLYGYSLVKAIGIAWNGKVGDLPTGIGWTLTTVGGFVSALIIAELAITKPTESLGARLLVAPAGSPGNSQWWVARLSWAYVLVWTVLGLAAYIVGEMWYPGNVPALTTFASAWLGLAVAAGYSYFGINN